MGAGVIHNPLLWRSQGPQPKYLYLLLLNEILDISLMNERMDGARHLIMRLDDYLHPSPLLCAHSRPVMVLIGPILTSQAHKPKLGGQASVVWHLDTCLHPQDAHARDDRATDEPQI